MLNAVLYCFLNRFSLNSKASIVKHGVGSSIDQITQTISYAKAQELGFWITFRRTICIAFEITSR